MKKLLLLVLMAVLAAAASSVARARIDDQSGPQALIRSATGQVLDEIRHEAIAPGDSARVIDIVNRDILPYVDFDYTTRLALGRYWREATPAQRQALVVQFRTLLIRLYAGALAQLRPDQQIEYPPQHVAPSATDALVRTVALTRSQPVEIDYRLRKTAQGWRVYDLNVLGAWLVQTYREQFGEQIRQSGLDGLIRTLTEQNQALAAPRP